MRTPAAEVEIDAALIERLVRDQFPDLSAPVRVVANGWDNVVARLGDQHVVRMPRRAAAVPLVENEARWLPGIAARLPVPVPTPERVGAPGRGYPWPWTIARWTPGVPVSELPVGDRGSLAGDLARVHAALHTPAPIDAPVNPVRGVPLGSRTDAVGTRLARLDRAHASVLRSAFEEGLAAPQHAAPPVWFHGDPHPANLLATGIRSPRLAAVIDFGDIGCGDPAVDLAIAWTAFDAEGRAAYRAALRPDDPLWSRARAWAAVVASALLESSDDHPAHTAIAAHTLAQLPEP